MEQPAPDNPYIIAIPRCGRNFRTILKNLLLVLFSAACSVFITANVLTRDTESFKVHTPAPFIERTADPLLADWEVAPPTPAANCPPCQQASNPPPIDCTAECPTALCPECPEGSDNQTPTSCPSVCEDSAKLLHPDKQVPDDVLVGRRDMPLIDREPAESTTRAIDVSDEVRDLLRAAPRLKNLLPFPPMKPGRITFITYGDQNFERSRNRIIREAQSFGVFDRTIGYTPLDIDHEYAERNKKLLSRKRGGGYWAWKSYFVYRTLLGASDGDIVFYNDAGSTFRRDPTPLIALAARYGAVMFRINLPIQDWAKGVVFKHLKMPINLWGKQPTIIGGTVILQRRPHTLELARQWMLLCQNMTLITDDVAKGVPNHPNFKEHRHDQSIWTLLVYKFGLPIVLQGGSVLADGPIISHTRVKGR